MRTVGKRAGRLAYARVPLVDPPLHVLPPKNANLKSISDPHYLPIAAHVSCVLSFHTVGLLIQFKVPPMHTPTYTGFKNVHFSVLARCLTALLSCQHLSTMRRPTPIVLTTPPALRKFTSAPKVSRASITTLSPRLGPPCIHLRVTDAEFDYLDMHVGCCVFYVPRSNFFAR